MRQIDMLYPGTQDESKVVEDGGVLFLIFTSTGEKRPCSKETCARFNHPESQAQIEARKRHDDEFLREYRAAMGRRTPQEIAEEEAEIRAAFGPGQRIVNVVTGKVTIT